MVKYGGSETGEKFSTETRLTDDRAVEKYLKNVEKCGILEKEFEKK